MRLGLSLAARLHARQERLGLLQVLLQAEELGLRHSRCCLGILELRLHLFEEQLQQLGVHLHLLGIMLLLLRLNAVLEVCWQTCCRGPTRPGCRTPKELLDVASLRRGLLDLELLQSGKRLLLLLRLLEHLQQLRLRGAWHLPLL